jgi:HEPN domain-containing protein
LKENKREAQRWLLQAENDFEYTKIGLREGFYAQVCFQCQQVCEKALKSIHYGELKKRIVFGHSLLELARELTLEIHLVDELAVLDQYYVSTRYPNGLPGALPYEVYTKKQAENAVHTAERVLGLAHTSLKSL